MGTRTYLRSFGGGELSPEFFGRIDDTKFQTGLAVCRNFVVKPHGVIENRAGFQFVLEVKNSAQPVRLISFTYSTTQTMVIELGAGYFRFHTQGATLMSGGVPYEIANPYAAADLFSINFVQSNDVLTLVHPNYAPMELRRLGALSWTLTAVNFGSTLSPPGGVSANANTNGQTYSYVVAGLGATVTTPPNQESVPSSSVTVSNNLDVPNAYNALTWTFAVGNWSYSVYRSRNGGQYEFIGSAGGASFNDFNNGASASHGPGLAPGGPYAPTAPTGLSASANAGDLITYSYVVTAVGSQSIDESLPSSAATCSNNLLAVNTSNTITWSAVSGATSYNVYALSNGLYGLIGSAGSSCSFKDDNITPDVSKGPPMPLPPYPSPGAGDYPAAVSYFEQRRILAGTANQPQNIWMTRSGTESNLNYSIPTKDDDAIGFKVAAREANTIRHIVPLTSLLLLTSSAEWRVTSLNSDAITPTTISVAPQSYVGANQAQPVIINNNVVYGAARGGHLRELTYSWQANAFVTGDLSLRAAHLFDNYDIVDLAYQKAPIPVVWMVSTSGQLIGLTYVPEQQVGAFHRHDTINGQFESCCIVAEGNEDVLYVIVRRTINGQIKRYVECKHTRVFVDPKDAFFVDCGMTYSGAPATTISGLDWLEGQTVSVLGDGAVMPNCVVTSGRITLPQAVSTAQIGLPIQADGQTLPVAFDIPGYGQGRPKNVNRVWLRTYRSSGVWVGPSFDKLTEFKQRQSEPYGSPPELFTDEVGVTITPSWGNDGKVCFRQSYPLPLTVVGLSLDIVEGG